MGAMGGEPDGVAASATGALRFPAGFLWGVATAAHQVEGNTTANQWTRWEQTGHIKSGDRCGLACDWWAHAERDFDLARELGVNALRLSVEWSRIEPRPGEWDTHALARYREMLRGLRDRGIEPMVTLHHFTNPLWFEERGAFLAPDSVHVFERFVARVVAELADLCDFWCTINEPNIYAIFGYQLGDFPPGRKGAIVAAFRAQANMARAHAAAYHTIHAIQPDARVGWAHHYNTFDPARPDAVLDRWAARTEDSIFHDFFPDAIRTGRARFPTSLVAGDLRAAHATCDFVGINGYYRDVVRFDLTNPLELFGRRTVAPGAKRGDPGVDAPGGEIYPQGIARAALRAAAMGKPIYVTESGVADASDRLRPWVIARSVHAMHDARAASADVRGYFHWSLVDNFEWAQGWSQRFGLVALDEKTQERTLRPSASFYSTIARENALTRDLVSRYAPSALAELFASAPSA